MTATSWTEQAERGSGRLMRFYAWLAMTSGRRLAIALLYPIGLYFILFSRAAAPASRKYLHRVLGRKPRFSEVFTHYMTFCHTLLDRLYFHAGRLGEYEFDIKGVEHLERLVANGRGCILLGSHLGSFDALRVLGTIRRGLPIRALYFPHNSNKLDSLFARVNPGYREQMIPLGSPTSMIEAKEFVDQGGIVGLLGDRALPSNPVERVDFLGQPAPFPVWPFRIAASIDAPVCLFFALRRGARRYEIVFEPFAERITRAQLRDPEECRALVERYAGRLQHHTRGAVYNWFNFYDFWNWNAGAAS